MTSYVQYGGHGVISPIKCCHLASAYTVTRSVCPAHNI